jgi:hypothetical protein
VIWNDHFFKDNNFTTMEIKGFDYIISDTGEISCENEKIIFPKKQIRWKDRIGVQFYEESDTVKKMLGEIK